MFSALFGSQLLRGVSELVSAHCYNVYDLSMCYKLLMLWWVTENLLPRTY